MMPIPNTAMRLRRLAKTRQRVTLEARRRSAVYHALFERQVLVPGRLN